MSAATAREWADAYLAQARADLEGARVLSGTSPSVFAMVLQMVFEKLAKAALLRSGAVNVAWAQGTHAAASRMVLVMLRERARIAPLGGSPTWQHVLSIVITLEQAHPQVAARLSPGSPQLEYPWVAVDGTVQWPARHLAIAASLGSPQNNLGARVLRFATLLAERFDHIFP